MSCPTCSGTMQKVCDDGQVRHFWCPRCGTVKMIDAGNFESTEAPTLVTRARVYQRDCIVAGRSTVDGVSMWFRIGLPEAIDVPADRPG